MWIFKGDFPFLHFLFCQNFENPHTKSGLVRSETLFLIIIKICCFLKKGGMSKHQNGIYASVLFSKRGLVPPGRWSSSTRDQRYISRFLAGRVLSTAALSSSLVVLGFLRRLLRPKPLIILDVVATAVPQSRTIFLSWMVCIFRVAVRAGLWSLQRGILAPCLTPQ